jgi:hypothetical protein
MTWYMYMKRLTGLHGFRRYSIEKSTFAVTVETRLRKWMRHYEVINYFQVDIQIATMTRMDRVDC